MGCLPSWIDFKLKTYPILFRIDNLAKSPEFVMPDLIRHPVGVESLDSDLRRDPVLYEV